MEEILQKAKKKYDYVGPISEGMISVRKEKGKEQLYGFIDESGMEVIPLMYEVVWNFSFGYSKVCKIDQYGKRKWGFIDKSGKEVIPIIYDSVQHIRDNFVFVSQHNKWGGIKLPEFELVIPIQYDWIYPFKNGKAVFRIGEEFGEVGKDGEHVHYISKNV